MTDWTDRLTDAFSQNRELSRRTNSWYRDSAASTSASLFDVSRRTGGLHPIRAKSQNSESVYHTSVRRKKEAAMCDE